MFNLKKEPKPIKLTSGEIERFQQLLDKKVALDSLLQTYGLEERLLWEGLKEKYNFNTKEWKWAYNRKKEKLVISNKQPSWAKERLL